MGRVMMEKGPGALRLDADILASWRTPKWIAMTRTHHIYVLQLHFCKGAATATGACARRGAAAQTEGQGEVGDAVEPPQVLATAVR